MVPVGSDFDELYDPDWLRDLDGCPFCGSRTRVEFDPANPMAAVWRCLTCGASGVTSPPDGTVPIEPVVVI